jgi:hypothetical protein
MVGRKLPLLEIRFQGGFDGEIGMLGQRGWVRRRDGCRGWRYVGGMDLGGFLRREKAFRRGFYRNQMGLVGLGIHRLYSRGTNLRRPKGHPTDANSVVRC